MLKMYTAVSATCALVSISALPVLADEVGAKASEPTTPHVLTARAVRAPIQMAPISVLQDRGVILGRNTCGQPAPEEARKLNALTAGIFIPTSVPSALSADIGFSVAIERTFASTKAADYVGSLRYSRFTVNSGTNSADVNLVNPMLGYRYRLGEDRKFYLEPGLGLAWVSGNSTFGGGGSTEFAFSLAGGYDMTNFLVDVRYLGGGSDSDRGVVVSVGGRF